MSRSGFVLKINNLDDDAFVDHPEEEVARILRLTADQILDGRDCGAVKDINGNNVGNWDLELPEEE